MADDEILTPEIISQLEAYGERLRARMTPEQLARLEAVIPCKCKGAEHQEDCRFAGKRNG